MTMARGRRAGRRSAARSRMDRVPTCHCAAAPARGPGASNRAIQAKLTIGRQDDPLEREADRAADRVLAGGLVGSLGSVGDRAQRKCAGCEAEETDTVRRQPIDEEEEMLQAKAEGADTIRRQPIEEEEELLQPKAEAGGMGAGGTRGLDAEGAALVVATGGRPLSAAERGYYEPRFGRDFSAVRIHDDSRAQAASAAINARAFTLGRDIAFSAGATALTGRDGRRLMAHELSHVVQQTQPGARTGPSGFQPASPMGALSAAPAVIARDPPTRPTSENVWGFRVARSMCGCRAENQSEIDWANEAIRIYRGCDLPAFTTGTEVQHCFDRTAYGPAPAPAPSGTTSSSGVVTVAPAATGSGACDRLIEHGTKVHEVFHSRQGDRISRSLGTAFFAEWSRLRGTPNRLDAMRAGFPTETASFDAQWNEASNWVAGEVESFTWERRFRADAKRALSRIC